MKKIHDKFCAIATAFLMLFSCLTSFTATAGSYENSIGLSEAYGAPGEEVTIYLYIDTVNNDCDSFSGWVEFDSELEFVSVSALNGNNINWYNHGDYISIAGFSSSYMEGTVAQLTFRIPEDSSSGDVFNISLDCDFFGADGEVYAVYSMYYSGVTVEYNLPTEPTEDVTEAPTKPYTLPTEPVYPVDGNSIGFSDVYGAPGEEVTVNLNVKSVNNDCDSFNGWVEFDSGLEFVSAAGSNRNNINWYDHGDYISIAGFSSSYIEGSVAQLTFRIPEDSSDGDVFSVFFECDFFGADGEAYGDYAIYSGRITTLATEYPTEESTDPTEKVTETVTKPTTTRTTTAATTVATVQTSTKTTTAKPVQTGTNSTTTKTVQTDTKTTTVKPVQTGTISTTVKPVQTGAISTTAKPVQTDTKTTTTKSVQTGTTPGISTAVQSTGKPEESQTKASAVISIEQGGTAVIPNVSGDVEFVSKDPNIAVVAPDGTVSGKSDGSTVIYIIKDGNIIDTVEVNITSSIYYGDVDFNTHINIFDAVIVARYTVGKQSLSEKQLSAADVDKNNAVNIFDAVIIARHTVGVKFPWE